MLLTRGTTIYRRSEDCRSPPEPLLEKGRTVMRAAVCRLPPEHNVTVEWRKLLCSDNFTTETIRQAERLLGQLPLESPLRVRLSKELAELGVLVGSNRVRNAKHNA